MHSIRVKQMLLLETGGGRAHISSDGAADTRCSCTWRKWGLKRFFILSGQTYKSICNTVLLQKWEQTEADVALLLLHRTDEASVCVLFWRMNWKCQHHHGSGNEAKDLWSLQWNNLRDHCQRLVSVDGSRSLCTPACFLNRKYLWRGEVGESGRYLQLRLFWPAGGATARWSESWAEFSGATQAQSSSSPLGLLVLFVPWRWDHGCWVTDRVAWWRIRSARKGHRSDFLSELWAGPRQLSSILSGAALSRVSVYALLAFWCLYLCEKTTINK